LTQGGYAAGGGPCSHSHGRGARARLRAHPGARGEHSIPLAVTVSECFAERAAGLHAHTGAFGFAERRALAGQHAVALARSVIAFQPDPKPHSDTYPQAARTDS